MDYTKTEASDLQSLEQCRQSIKLYANNLAADMSSTIVNQGRIDSLRSLLDLFERYNNQIERRRSRRI